MQGNCPAPLITGHLAKFKQLIAVHRITFPITSHHAGTPLKTLFASGFREAHSYWWCEY